tara:strand:- start:13416 stop:14027 length:612 start_codon:yes stop_codon:yes gene_type:complete
MKKSFLLFLFIGLISCTSNTIFKEPDDLIPKEKMVELITDLYLTNSAKSYRNNLKERNIDYTFLVYEKHGIDSTRFKRSNFYYTTKIDDYEDIYLEVEKNIKALNTNFKAIKKERDSIKNDSIKTIRFVKDSILKVAILKDSVLLDIINMQMKDSTQRYDLKKVKRLRRTLNMDSLRKAHPFKEIDTISAKLDSLQTKTFSKR